jgi:ABC-type molybdate transport system ATPase subunit
MTSFSLRLGPPYRSGRPSIGTAHVWIDVGGQTITASITKEAVDELKLEKG